MLVRRTALRTSMGGGIIWTKFPVFILGLNMANILSFTVGVWRNIIDYSVAFDPTVFAINRTGSLARFTFNAYASCDTYICLLATFFINIPITKMFSYLA